MGAEFCHGQNGNIVYELVKNFGFLKGSEEDELKGYTSGGKEIDKKIFDKCLDLIAFLRLDPRNKEKQNRCKDEVSYGDCLEKRYEELLNKTNKVQEKNILKKFKPWFHILKSSDASALDIHDLSVISHFEIEGDPLMNWNGQGYAKIFDVLMHKYPETAIPLPLDERIFLNKEVVRVSKWDEGDLVEVTCNDGSIYAADQVLFSPSIGVLKANHKKIFDPPLPQDKVEAIDNIGFGAICKIFLVFPEATNLTFEMATIFEEDEFNTKNKHLNWLRGLSTLAPAANQPKVIYGWYSGKFVVEIENLSDTHVAEGQKYIVDKFLRPVLNVSNVVQIIRTSWYTNPYFRGTYSYESVSGTARRKEYVSNLARPLRNGDDKSTVAFIGEATSPNHYSTVHGAIESGFKEAKRIVSLL